MSGPILLNHPCMSHDDFEEYKQSINDVLTGPNYRYEHSGEKDYWIWPALIMTVLTVMRDPKKQCLYLVDCDHTSISQKRLLKVLGLSKEEIKIEFGAISTAVSELDVIENREV